MFRSLARLPIRRGIRAASTSSHAEHQTPAQLNMRLNLALGASAAVGTYITWYFTHGSNTIHADAPTHAPKKPIDPPKAAATPSIIKEEVEQAEQDSGFVPEEKNTTNASVAAPEDPDAEAAPASGGAYDPVTGKINWDCPCLGGMAHGTCGPEFREAFSCFIYSEDEPKGINCVEKFKAMQGCFREHPDEYPDEEEEDTLIEEAETALGLNSPPAPAETVSEPPQETPTTPTEA